MATTILSPHPDDAVLSLWHVLTGPGEVSVVNVFTGEPEATELGWWDMTTGATDPQSRAAERQAEDREALALAGREPVNLGFVDLQYRCGDLALETVVEAIAEAAPEGALLAPATVVADHPDHSLVREAALALRERGRDVSLYADLPHATRNGVPDTWSLDLNGADVPAADLMPEVHALDAAQEARKREAVERYRTQLAGLDGLFDLAAHPERLRYEVVWPLPPASPA
jgi:LmbE family N-acetylglucosaminyl deacetylase